MAGNETDALPAGAKSREVFLSLREQIANGRLTQGEKLPGEEQLAEKYGVSRVTVRRALDVLAGRGLVERRAGSGTKVAASAAEKQPVVMDFTTLLPQLVEIGRRTSISLLAFGFDSPPGFVADALDLAEDETTQIATRMRSADGVPFSYLTTYVPAGIAASFSRDDLATTPLYKLLERGGVQINDARQTVSATLAGPEVADALGVPVGSALLSLERVMYDIERRGVEYLSGLYRPDMFRLDMNLTRVGQGGERHWEPAIGPAVQATP